MIDQIVATIVALFNSVPIAVWTGVIATLSALAAVWITNRGHSDRLEKQMRNDREQKQTDRLWMLKREIYVRANREITEAVHMIAKIIEGSPDDTQKVLNTITGKISVLSEVQLISGPEVYASSRNLSLRLSQVISKCATEKTHVDDLVRKRELLSNNCKEYDVAIAEIVGESKEPPPYDDTNLTHRHLADLVLKQREAQKELAKCSIDIFNNKMSTVRKIHTWLSELNPFLDNAIFDTRRELGVECLDRAVIGSLTTEGDAESKRLADDFIADLSQRVNSTSTGKQQEVVVQPTKL